MIRLNKYPIEEKIFPNKESYIDGNSIMQIVERADGIKADIEMIYEDDRDLMLLFLLNQYLKDGGFDRFLTMKYVPYSRMDRVKTYKDAFSLKYICDFINNMDFKTVTIMEPHSDVTPALLERTVVLKFFEPAMDWLIKEETCEKGDYIMYPDASAEKRYSERLKMKYLLGIKHRDWATGKITDYQAFNTTGEELNIKSNVFIVDDLCAKGTTAYQAGLALRNLGFKRIYLLVAHCEPTIFDGLLLNKDSPVKTIYTSDSMNRPESDKIKVIK